MSSIDDPASTKGDRALLLPVLPAPLLFEFVCGGDGNRVVRDLATGSSGSLERSSLPRKMAETGRDAEGRRDTDMGAHQAELGHTDGAQDTDGSDDQN